MQRRERLLAITTAGLLGLVGAQLLYGSVQARFDDRHARLEGLRRDIDEKETQILRGKRIARQLADWQRRSLPADVQLARSLYQNWLSELVDQVQLSKANVVSSPVTTRRDAYHRLPFSVRGQGTLTQVTELLYKFYRADHLHRIVSLNLTPLEAAGDKGGKTLDVFLSIEALALPAADRTDALNAAPAERLALADLEAYRKIIVERNLFAPYSPPPIAKKDGPEFDAARHAFLTAVLESGGRPQAWLNVRTSGELMKLHEGDTFKVGPLNGTITKITISPRAIEYEADGRRRRVPLGKSLRDGKELPARGASGG